MVMSAFVLVLLWSRCEVMKRWAKYTELGARHCKDGDICFGDKVYRNTCDVGTEMNDTIFARKDEFSGCD
jgi:hypothetical protein